jgi:hypothetical protein
MLISEIDLSSLAHNHTNGFCVSLYAPTHRAGREKSQDPIRLRNMIRTAEKRMRQAGLRVPAVKEVIRPARELLRKPGFWRNQDRGLALFLSADTHLHYHLPIRPARSLVLSRRFHVKPLLPVLSGDGSFCLLALSLNRARILWGTRDSLVPTDVDGLPGSMAQALRGRPPQEQLQWHTRTGDTGRGGKRAAIFHGQGGERAARKDEILRFFRQVDRSVSRFLQNRRTPLIVAGVDYLLPIYRKANSYPHLTAVLPVGNPEKTEPEELHMLAWDAVRAVLTRRRDEAFRSFRRHAGAGDGRASSDIRAILPAAFQGRVEFLVVDAQAHAWGIFDPAAGFIRYRPPTDEWAEDMFDLAAVQVLLRGGEVFAVPAEKMPVKASIAAVFRF